jgi:acetate kinase
VLIDDDVLTSLRDLVPLAPLHQPLSLEQIVAARAMFPAARHVACFDTAFHAHWPPHARHFALPRAWYDQGLRRYGFHGLSHQFAANALRAAQPGARRAVIAHLGSGCSLCSLRDFGSVDCSMGFSALDGLPMGTRCGALDPGAVLYLLRQSSASVDSVESMLYRQSGLLGLSGISGDLRELLASTAPDAALAIDYFVHRTASAIAASMVALDGLDALVFTGGIGENAPRIRAEVCARLSFAGLRIDPARNDCGAARIDAPGSSIAVHVVAADEESVMAGLAIQAC